MSWVRMIRGRGRKIRPDEPDSVSGHDKSSQDFGHVSNETSRSPTKDSRAPVRLSSQSDAFSRITRLIKHSKREVDVDSDSDDGQPGLFRRAASNESIKPVATTTKATERGGQGFLTTSGGFDAAADMALETSRSKTSGSRVFTVYGVPQTFSTSPNSSPKRGLSKQSKNHWEEKVIDSKLSNKIRDILLFLRSKAVFLRPIIALSSHLNFGKFRKHHSFNVAVDFIHVSCGIAAYLLIPNKSPEFILAKITYGITFSLAFFFFCIRAIPFPAQIASFLQSYKPILDFSKLVLIGIIFWCTTILSYYYGTSFYNKVYLCYKSCRSTPYEGISLTCEREYATNGTALCTDQEYEYHQTTIRKFNSVSWVVVIHQLVEVFIFAMTASDTARAIKKGELFENKDEEDELLDQDLDENIIPPMEFVSQQK